jgi:hypothetical protein
LHALKYISYPAQVLAKSSKLIPVMLMGSVLHGKRYSMLEYVCCLAISGELPPWPRKPPLPGCLPAFLSAAQLTQRSAQPLPPLARLIHALAVLAIALS